SGSAGLDLAAAVDVSIKDNRPVPIPTGVKGPVTYQGQPVPALLLGRSSTFLKGLDITVGLIDADFTGEICILARTLYPPVLIPAGTRIARLLPFSALVPEHRSEIQRGDSGLGSTGGSAFLTLGLSEWPKRLATLELNGQRLQLTLLSDMGVDITIIN
ncbi:POK9 protein, partial [Sterrhoptilus dennistouni]|nr:POK9 protein [Sterrhoptilus dennistouni]